MILLGLFLATLIQGLSYTGTDTGNNRWLESCEWSVNSTKHGKLHADGG